LYEYCKSWKSVNYKIEYRQKCKKFRSVFSDRKEDREREREKSYIIGSIFTEGFKHKFCKRVINEETFSVKNHP